MKRVIALLLTLLLTVLLGAVAEDAMDMEIVDAQMAPDLFPDDVELLPELELDLGSGADDDALSLDMSADGADLIPGAAPADASNAAVGEQIVVDGIQYNITADGAVVLGRTPDNWNPVSVTIPSMVEGYPVTAIGANAFASCTSLTEIAMPSGLVTIGDSAFSRCTALINVNLPDSLTAIGTNAFAWCSALSDIVLPNGLTTLGGSVFQFCDKMERLEIPVSVTACGSYPCNGCSALTEFIAPHCCLEGFGRFHSALKSLSVLASGSYAISDDMFYSCKSLERVTFADGLTSIGDRAFYECAALSDVTLPDTLTHIGDSAFRFCTSLKRVEVPASVTSCGGGLFGVFGWCTSLEELTVPACIINAGDTIYMGPGYDAPLTRLTILPGGQYAIPAQLFERCKTLEEIMLPSGLTAIGTNAFFGCGLKHIDIPDGITHIGSGAFAKCQSLKRVVIPDSVTQMGDTIFSGYKALETVYVPQLTEGMFEGCANLREITIHGREVRQKSGHTLR